MNEQPESWVRACGTSACLEVTRTPAGRVAIRNSQLLGVRVEVSLVEWREFLEAVHRGDIA